MSTSQPQVLEMQPQQQFNIDLEAQPLPQPESSDSQQRKASECNSEAASKATSSKSSKSLGRWEEYKPGKFKPLCPHRLEHSKCHECGAGKSQKKLFWAAGVLCALGILAMFIVVAIIETRNNGEDGKPGNSQ